MGYRYTKNNAATRRTDRPVGYRYKKNNAAKKEGIPTILGLGAPSFRKHLGQKSATSVVARV